MESSAPVTVSQACAPAKKSFLPFRSSSPFFSWTKIRLPSFKKLKRSSVESSTMSSLQTDDLMSSKSISFSMDANQCSRNTEEMMPENTQMNDVEVQTVDVVSTEDEPFGPMIDKMLDELLDEKANVLEMEFNVKIAEWAKIKNEEKVKLKRKIARARQRRHREIENLKLRVKVMERKDKRQKQMEKKKLKDLEKEMNNEKSKLLLELEELKQKLKMEKMEECNRKKMENKSLKRKFKITFRFWGLKKKI
ncbi:DNA ligase 1-like [Trichomycterus rosablanca]|uniref:DNA ligase 1-like n=1 Tax=Trichomycterus rosablanca TaxID=2290929 RepID=UPI002F3510A1